MGRERNNSINLQEQIEVKSKIGLDSLTNQTAIKILNITLADEVVLSMKTRSAHWNVRGAGFYDRYTLFDIQYKQLNDISDEIAKRVRMLDGLPISSLEEFFNNTRLDEQPGIVPDIIELSTDHETIIHFLGEDIRKYTEDYEDAGTFDLLVSILRVHEKMAWMLRSYLENEQIPSKTKKGLIK